MGKEWVCETNMTQFVEQESERITRQFEMYYRLGDTYQNEIRQLVGEARMIGKIVDNFNLSEDHQKFMKIRAKLRKVEMNA